MKPNKKNTVKRKKAGQPRSLSVAGGSAPYEPRKKPTKAAVYAWIYPNIQRIAREHGYALGLHGSMNRDLDLIACPWTEEAATAEVLVAAIMHAVDGDFAPWDIEAGNNPCVKPHGRRAWSIYFSGHQFYIDLSIMPLSLQND